MKPYAVERLGQNTKMHAVSQDKDICDLLYLVCFLTNLTNKVAVENIFLKMRRRRWLPQSYEESDGMGTGRRLGASCRRKNTSAFYIASFT